MIYSIFRHEYYIISAIVEEYQMMFIMVIFRDLEHVVVDVFAESLGKTCFMVDNTCILTFQNKFLFSFQQVSGFL